MLDDGQLWVGRQFLDMQFSTLQPTFSERAEMLHIPATHPQTVIKRTTDELALNDLRASTNYGFKRLLRGEPLAISQSNQHQQR